MELVNSPKETKMELVKEQIIELLESTEREGIVKVIHYLEDSDFFTAPASTKFHGAQPGGLAEHSLAVYCKLSDLWERVLENITPAPGQIMIPVKPENLIIAGLLHDVCKIGAYILNPAAGTYKWNRQQPAGHAVLSIGRISGYIKLEELELLLIRFHMGVYGLFEFAQRSGEYPLRGEEGKSKEERYGQSLANAWYHNPVVKLIYLCDELTGLEE